MFYRQPEKEMHPWEKSILVEKAKQALLYAYNYATDLPITPKIHRNFKSIQDGHHNLPIPGRFITTASQIHQYLHPKAEFIPLKEWPMRHLVKLIRDCYGEEYTDDSIPAHMMNPDLINNNNIEEGSEGTTTRTFALNKIYPQRRVFYMPTCAGCKQIYRIHETEHLQRRERRERFRIMHERQLGERGLRRRNARQARRLKYSQVNGRARAEWEMVVRQESREEDESEVMLDAIDNELLHEMFP